VPVGKVVVHVESDQRRGRVSLNINGGKRKNSRLVVFIGHETSYKGSF